MQTKRLVELAVVLMHIKDFDAAEQALLRALSMTNDFGEATPAATYRPRIYHRMAELEARRGNWSSAIELFELTENSFDKANVVGRARNLRTQAVFTRENGDHDAGLELANRARAILQHPRETGPTWEKEYVVTNGVIARTDDSLDTDDVAEQLLIVDDKLRGGNDPIYERDNLAALMSCVPISERVSFRMRYHAIGLRLVASQELSYVLRDLGDGDIRGVLFGPTGRMTRRLFSL
jgi:tetratricopeptide (TPR) repeat protein